MQPGPHVGKYNDVDVNEEHTKKKRKATKARGQSTEPIESSKANYSVNELTFNGQESDELGATRSQVDEQPGER